ncbi:unnamed protein product [Lampetra planeri]
MFLHSEPVFRYCTITRGEASSGSRMPGIRKEKPDGVVKKGSARKEPKRPRSKDSSTSARSTGRGTQRSTASTDLKDQHGQEDMVVESAPTGVLPLFLSTQSQELLGLRADEDVTAAAPVRLLPKETLLADVRQRGATSDLHPFRQTLQDSECEELLIGYDPDFRYGQKFYLVVTKEAQENILNVSTPDMALDEPSSSPSVPAGKLDYRPPSSRPWVSLGSDADIDEASSLPTRPQLRFSVSRPRREFGSPLKLSDAEPGRMRGVDCASCQDPTFSLRRMEVDADTQAVPLTREQGSQTTWRYPRNACTQSEPRTMSEEQQSTLLSSSSVQTFLSAALPRMEMVLQQGVIANVFVDEWAALVDEEGSGFGGHAITQFREHQSFSDLRRGKGRAVSCVDWHPSLPGVVCVSMVERASFDERIDRSSHLIVSPSLLLIWSFTDPIHPQLLLEAPEDILSFQFSPTDSNIIAGGCFNGQVVLWDISEHVEKLQLGRTGGHQNGLTRGARRSFEEDEASVEDVRLRWCAVSAIEHGHRAPVSHVQWLPAHFEVTRAGAAVENESRMCLQLLTSATDCSILMWDVRPGRAAPPGPGDKKRSEHRQIDDPSGVPTTFKHLNLTWRPLLKVTLPRLESGGEYNPVCCSLQERSLPEPSHERGGVGTQRGDVPGYGAMHRVASAKQPQALDAVSTRLLVGTQDGELVCTDWRPEKDNDSGKLSSTKPLAVSVVHAGPVHTVQASPLLPGVLLTADDDSFALWKEGGTGEPPLLLLLHGGGGTAAATANTTAGATNTAPGGGARRGYTAGCWSPSRAALVFLARADGALEAWDLLDRTHAPLHTQAVSPASLTFITPRALAQRRQLLAVGDELGTLHILEVPRALRHGAASEVSAMLAYLDRERDRLEFTLQRQQQREREKQQQKAEQQQQGQRRQQKGQGEDKQQQQDELERRTYDEFLELEKLLLSQLNLESRLQEA